VTDDDSFNDGPTPMPEHRDRDRRGSGATPVVPGFDSGDRHDITDPISWLEGDLDAAARDIVERSARSAGDGTPWGQFAKLINREDLRHRKVVGALKDLRKSISPDTLKAIHSTNRTVKTAKRIAIAVVIAAAGSLTAAVASYSAHERQIGADSVRLTHAEDAVKNCQDAVKNFQGSIDNILLELGRRSRTIVHPSTTVDDALAKGLVP
jgi:hypothetical protein